MSIPLSPSSFFLSCHTANPLNALLLSVHRQQQLRQLPVLGPARVSHCSTMILPLRLLPHEAVLLAQFFFTPFVPQSTYTLCFRLPSLLGTISLTSLKIGMHLSLPQPLNQLHRCDIPSCYFFSFLLICPVFCSVVLLPLRLAMMDLMTGNKPLLLLVPSNKFSTLCCLVTLSSHSRSSPCS